MAFTPEDVLNKHFTATQFRRGYDEQEVDDFLDEIVVELRRLSSDNDDLAAQLKACQESKAVALAKTAVVSAAASGTGVRAESTIPGSDKNGALAPAAANSDDEIARNRAAVAARVAGERLAQDRIAAAVAAAEQAEKDAAARVSRAKTDAEQAEAQAAERIKAAKEAKDAADKAATGAKDAADKAATGAKDAADKAATGVKDAADKAATAAKNAADAAAKNAADDAARNAADKAARDAADKNVKSSFGAPAPAPVATQAEVHNAAAGVLALAQKLHEEYVAEGQNTRERLIGEGQAHHDKVVGEAAAKQAEFLSTGRAKHDEFVSTGQAKHAELLSTGQAKHDSLIAEASARHEQMITEARERSTGMVAEAQQKKAEVLQALGRERDLLQKKIDELRIFERDYRARLKSYLESQLHELDHTGVDAAAEGGGDDNAAGQSATDQQHVGNEGQHNR